LRAIGSGAKNAHTWSSSCAAGNFALSLSIETFQAAATVSG
jgi:hypothetical protein